MEQLQARIESFRSKLETSPDDATWVTNLRAMRELEWAAGLIHEKQRSQSPVDARITQLEARVAELEARPFVPPQVPQPSCGMCGYMFIPGIPHTCVPRNVC